MTAGSAEKIDFCVRELGATAGFNYRTQDWSAELRKTTDGKGVDLIVDFIGASYFQGNVNAAGMDGKIVCLGLMGGATLPDGVNIGPFIRKRLTFQGSTLRSRDEDYQRRLRDMLVEHACPLFESGGLRLFVSRVLRWEDIVEAHQLMESNQTMGKIICTIS